MFVWMHGCVFVCVFESLFAYVCMFCLHMCVCEHANMYTGVYCCLYGCMNVCWYVCLHVARNMSLYSEPRRGEKAKRGPFVGGSACGEGGVKAGGSGVKTKTERGGRDRGTRAHADTLSLLGYTRLSWGPFHDTAGLWPDEQYLVRIHTSMGFHSIAIE